MHYVCSNVDSQITDHQNVDKLTPSDLQSSLPQGLGAPRRGWVISKIKGQVRFGCQVKSICNLIFGCQHFGSRKFEFQQKSVAP
jgi:hypothetical protein